MKIAIIGSRGIPANYGGFETFAEGLSTRLVDNGYDITVTCEYEHPESRSDEYKGVKLEYFPIKPPESYLLRKFYENLSDIYFLIKLSRRYDLIYFLGIEVGMFLFIPKLFKRSLELIVNIDGVMWERNKFNIMEKWLLRLNHIMATIYADTIVADAEEMKKYVRAGYQNKTTFIPYGIERPPKVLWNKENLTKLSIPEKEKLRIKGSKEPEKTDSKVIISDIMMYGMSIPAKIQKKKNYNPVELSPDGYWLVVARLEPENNIHKIVEGYARSNAELPLVIVGDFTSNEYKNKIHEIIHDNDKIHLLGSIYDLEILNMLRQNCFAYIHGHTVGGTNPSLLEAMIMKNIIIAHNNPFNYEVCLDSALYFKDSHELKEKMEQIESNYDNYVILKEDAYRRVNKGYSWEKITNDYEKLFSNSKIF